MPELAWEGVWYWLNKAGEEIIDPWSAKELIASSVEATIGIIRLARFDSSSLQLLPKTTVWVILLQEMRRLPFSSINIDF